MLTYVLFALIGWMLADHYETSVPKTILASIVFGFVNVWIFLHLTERRKIGRAASVGLIVLLWFTVGFVIGLFTILTTTITRL